MAWLDSTLVGTSALALAFALSACGGGAAQGLDPRVARPEPTAAEQRAAAAELYRLGKEQARAGDSLRAQEYFATAIDSGGDPNLILPELMRAAISGTRYQAAIRYFEDYGTLLNRRNRAELAVVAGVLYLGVEQPDRARAMLESALAVEPKNARAHFLLGQILRDEFSDYAASDSHFRAYLELEPNGESALLARAGLLKRPDEGLVVNQPIPVRFDASPVGVEP